MIIKIDVDGVIRNMFDSMCDVYNNEFNESLSVNDIFDYDVDVVFHRIKEELGINAAEFFFEQHAKELFLDSKPYNGVKEAIEKLMRNGHKVIIVTWQYTLENKLYTLMFLDKNNIPYDDICFTKDKWMIKSDWIIDDNPEFITDKREKSHKMLIKMPYNKGLRFEGLREKSLIKAVDSILRQEETRKIFCLSKSV